MLQNIYFAIFILSLYEVIGNLTLSKIPSLKAILYHPLKLPSLKSLFKLPTVLSITIL